MVDLVADTAQTLAALRLEAATNFFETWLPLEKSIIEGVIVITKQELQKYLQIDAQIDELILERCALMDRATKITPSLNGMPHATGVSDKIGDAIAIMDSIDQKIADKIAELRDEKERIEAAIANLTDARLRVLMRYRYIQGLTWEAISEKMGIELRWTYFLHNRALDYITPL